VRIGQFGGFAAGRPALDRVGFGPRWNGLSAADTGLTAVVTIPKAAVQAIAALRTRPREEQRACTEMKWPKAFLTFGGGSHTSFWSDNLAIAGAIGVAHHASRTAAR
jgi:hypothetical protein